MKSGEARPTRGRTSARDQEQGSLEGLLPSEEPRADRDEKGSQPVPSVKAGKKKAPSPPANGETGGGAHALRASLDALEETITLLLARHERLAAAHAVAEERSKSRDSLDPIELESRVKALEAKKERLERHAAFLEDRIRGLLSRMRYVIES
jgi:hypothetical protein